MKSIFSKMALLLVCSLFLLQARAGITILSPNGGELLQSWVPITVTFNVSGSTSAVNIYFSENGGYTYKVSKLNAVVNPNSVNSIQVNTQFSAFPQYVIKVEDAAAATDFDVTDKFIFVTPNLDIYAFDSVTTSMNTPITFSSSIFSTVSENHNFINHSGLQHGTLVLSGDSTFTYTPNPGFVGLDTLNYYITNDQTPVGYGVGFARIYVACSISADAGTDVVSCNPGSIALGGSTVASGGTAPYRYLWQSPNISLSDYSVANPTITGALTGTANFSLIVRDANGCEATDDVLISKSMAQFTIVTDNVANETCNSGNGSIELSITGNGAPFTFSWTGSTAVTEDLTPVSAGTYSVTVTDAGGCTLSQNFTVSSTGTPAFTIVQDSVGDEICGNAASGFIDISISGAGAPFSYAWAGGVSTQDWNGLVAGTYNVTVTSASGCMVSASFVVGYRTGMFVNGIVTGIGCSATGGIDLTVNGGSPPFTYLWSNAQTADDVQGVNIPGTYIVTVTDNNSCTEVRSYSITKLPNALGVSIPADTLLCAGDSVPLYLTSLLGGVWPYTVEWTANGVALPDTTGFWAKPVVNTEYIVNVTDFSGCTGTDTVEVNVSSDFITFQLDSIVSAGCPALYGDIYITTSSTALPLTYVWNDGVTTEDNTSALAGVHTVKIRNASGCWLEESFNVPYPVQAKINDGMDTTFCSLDSVKLYPYMSGGTKPYTFTMYSSLGLVSGDTIVTVKQASTANYRLLVTDAKGCTAADTVVIAIDTCVWPGDANYDGLVSSDDVLNLGLAYGATGTTRFGFMNWGRYVSKDWEAFFADGLDYEHADCNGNGIINHDDTLAVTNNYSLTHARGGWVNGDRFADPKLFTTFAADTVYAGDVLRARIQLGESTLPATDVFGISFRMHFPPGKVEEFRGLDFTGNWITSGNNNPIYFRKVNLAQGFADICVVRTDNTDKTGFGLVANADFVMKEDITGKSDNRTFSTFEVSYSNVKMISANEAALPVFADENEAVLAQFPNGLKDVNEAQATVYPNPVYHTMVLLADGVLKEVLLINSMGENNTVPMQINGNAANIDASGLSAGVYYLHLTTTNGKAVRRIVKY